MVSTSMPIVEVQLPIVEVTLHEDRAHVLRRGRV